MYVIEDIEWWTRLEWPQLGTKNRRQNTIFQKIIFEEVLQYKKKLKPNCGHSNDGN